MFQYVFFKDKDITIMPFLHLKVNSLSLITSNIILVLTFPIFLCQLIFRIHVRFHTICLADMSVKCPSVYRYSFPTLFLSLCNLFVEEVRSFVTWSFPFGFYYLHTLQWCVTSFSLFCISCKFACSHLFIC